LARLVERRRFFLFPRRNWTGEPALEALAQLPEPVPSLLRERWRGRRDLRAALERLTVAATGNEGAVDRVADTNGGEQSDAA
jgi:hypothetical protein